MAPSLMRKVDFAVGWGDDFVFHFHGFEYKGGLALVNLGAVLYDVFYEGAGHGGSEFEAVGGGLPLRGAGAGAASAGAAGAAGAATGAGATAGAATGA